MSSKGWKFKNLCGCRPPTATDAIEPKMIKSETDEKRRHCATPQMMSPCPKINDSLAVVKDSDDPYRDFRQSILQMISEKEIYSRSDLQQLLRCFLDLNPPRHHQIIVAAFMDIWNGGVAVADGGHRRDDWELGM